MRLLRFWFALALLDVVATATVAAAEPPAGSKNFTAPAAAPNYFSNEAGAPPGGAGIIRPSGPRPAIVEAEPPARGKVAAAAHRPTRHAASARSKRRATKLAAARGRHRAMRVAADRARKTRNAAAKSGSARAPAHSPGQAKTINAAAQGRAAPAKAKQPARHAG